VVGSLPRKISGGFCSRCASKWTRPYHRVLWAPRRDPLDLAQHGACSFRGDGTDLVQPVFIWGYALVAILVFAMSMAVCELFRVEWLKHVELLFLAVPSVITVPPVAHAEPCLSRLGRVQY